MQEQSEPEFLHDFGAGGGKPIDVPIVEPIEPVEIVVPEPETDDIVDKTSADEETISVEDNIPEITETDEEIEVIEVPAMPVFPDEPKYSVAELTEMAYVLDYLSDFFEGKGYVFFEEPQNVGSRYIYFAAHYVPRSPENAFDQIVGFEIKNEVIVPRFIIKNGDFIDADGSIFFSIPDYYVLHGFNFVIGGSSIYVDSQFVYDNARIGNADSFYVYWYEERETYGFMSQDDPNWQPGM